MDARDICRRLNCSPLTLSEWVDKDCPIDRNPPFASFELSKVREWLKENSINDLPKENDQDLDILIRVVLKALHRKEITPWYAEKVVVNLGAGIWG